MAAPPRIPYIERGRGEGEDLKSMAQATDISTRDGDVRTIALVSAAHFVSHYYILLLPPLFAFVRADYGVSYTEVGLALTAFNVMSTVLQTPAGFLVDRVGGRAVLFAGLLLGGASIAAAALVPWFWAMVVMFGMLGVANTVYHPANYAVLSHHVSHERMAQAFSIHTFAGILGSAAAFATLYRLASAVGWRGAWLAASLLGFLVAALFLFQRDPLIERAPAKPHAAAAKDGNGNGAAWDLLLSAPILRNLFFFVLLSLGYNGIQYYAAVALGALYGTSPDIANQALTAYFVLNACAVLAGGYAAGRTGRHDLIAALGLLTSASCVLLMGFVDLDTILLIVVMSIAGFASGFIMPSRDMIVRAVTPAGSFGKVFGFVTTGFNLAGIVAPLVYGAMMDHGSPRAIFLTVAGCAAAALLTVITMPKRRAA